MNGIEVTYDDFPDGLRCADCTNEIQWGDRYTERPEGMMGDTFADLTDEPVIEVSLICLRCAGLESDIVPLYDADLNPINREGEE